MKKNHDTINSAFILKDINSPSQCHCQCVFILTTKHNFLCRKKSFFFLKSEYNLQSRASSNTLPQQFEVAVMKLPSSKLIQWIVGMSTGQSNFYIQKNQPLLESFIFKTFLALCNHNLQCNTLQIRMFS